MGKSKTTAPAALSPKRQRFVEEYLVDLNATQAAMRAGYAPKTADREGCRLLRVAEVQRRISERRAAKTDENKITAERVLDELAALAFSDIGDVLDFTGDTLATKPPRLIPPAARRAISSVKVKRYVDRDGEQDRTVEVMEFKLWPKDPSLDKLARHFALLVDRHEITGKDGAPLTLDLIRDVLREAAGR